MFPKTFLLSFIFLVTFAVLANCLIKQRDCKCKLNVNSRIVGGRKAANNKYPWYASLSVTGFHKNNNDRSMVGDEYKIQDSNCGATIINEKWLITAAHCVTYGHEGVALGVGDNDLLNLFNNGKLPAKRVIPYPTYDTFDSFDDDFALIELEEPLTFNDTIAPACLGINYRSEPENSLISIGFGIMDGNYYHYDTKKKSGGTISRYLKEAESKDVSTLECRNQTTLICTKMYKEGDSTCQGDSGSPVSFSNNGKTLVLGVLSRQKVKFLDSSTLSYCNGDASYTRISPYFNFIKHYAGDVCTDADF